ncbi:acyltransferase [Acinetobacter baumannii]|uniref:acyltransferase n=4 Tax=Acinetobacter baumannii TaxID=470 RepID=UPI0004111684|nr:acyltransferase [Acinetobacter baumannii]EKU6712666.1 acyltransferase [Acinetobacter baumannii]EKV1866977.1 acyltransferase [Acinetobacter baumannii]EKV1944237.1 acyltransferase [Acinetobacter baumannii]EKV1991376.1 acyltransferase [Acinetobacter baumannii]EKW1033100.1 acyltransferase [Acinetobacter baumannii]
MNLSIMQIRSTACILVLLTHVSAAFNVNNSIGFQTSLIAFINQFSRFGTPLFCVITGFLFAKYFYSSINIKYFYQSRISKILIPYLVWSLIYSIIIFFFSKKLFSTFIQEPIISLLSGKAFYHLYFMSTILQFCLIFPLLRLLRNVNVFTLTVSALIINILSIVFLYKSDIYFISDRAFVGNWLFYFVFGIVFFRYKNFKFNLKVNLIIIATITFFILFEVLINKKLFESTRLENLIYIPILFATLYSVFNKKISNNLIKIGYYSMGIYLIHPILILVLKKIIPNIFFQQYPTSLFILILLITISFCMAFCSLISRFNFSKLLITLPKK